jgi:hypothetical protein
MALIALTTICLLACGFFLFVLIQWMRDTKRKTTRPEVDSRVGETRATRRPHIVGDRKTVERRDRFKVKAHRVSTRAARSGIRDSWYDESERMAYERIARSFKFGKSSWERLDQARKA